MVYINRWVHDVMDGHDYEAGLRVTGNKLRSYFTYSVLLIAQLITHQTHEDFEL